MSHIFRIVTLLVALVSTTALAQTPATSHTSYGQWENGISDDEDFFPIGVWLQHPRNAQRYRQAGINLYVGLWKGPTEEHLSVLKEAGMQVICSQNEVGMNSRNADVIVGWMHGDEPDNAQAKKSGGYGPPIEPDVVVKNYRRLAARDPTRPVLLNLGQGVAYDNYVGRGVRRNHPEDYSEYIRGSDIVSFDIYPAVHDKPEVAGKLEFVPRGVQRLRRWSNDEKIVWNCIECSRISNTKVKPTAAQIRSEVWMSLIAGSRGIIYFVHQFQPKFKEASVLDDPELLPAITALNQQIIKLAPVLNSPTVEQAVELEADAAESRISAMCKKYDGSLYAFLANQSPVPTSVTLGLRAPYSANGVEFLEDGKTTDLSQAKHEIELAAYGVQLLRFIDSQPSD